ncbi:tRNA (uridine(54)-C5)-methyltransferase TrmA [Spongiibacter nanhainus]|uniref:tRNA/tmRNA (uracil-C(5))-methyltransferase n=1 Tax=Spongiibacter nanhainus TaxID=2794344 RepID=A0A7T4URI8_9GAMM|nr:tRNA (uridine(54)-C5)-methyltransferase TrmA [Spongiibacter nanhainus]QQD19863.1 tRNA (uridine(54)-C5)-methyltransferase TrmA [Spongiibacter nanhainus]
MSPGAIDTSQYPNLLSAKVTKTRELMADLGLPEPEVEPSPVSHFRMRAEFRIWHEGDDLYYAMFDPQAPKVPIRVDDFPIASKAICELMPTLLDALKASTALRQRLFQVEFLSTLAGDMLVTLLYHRKLDDTWRVAAESLAENLGVQIIGRARKQKIVLDRDFVTETLSIEGRDYHYRQYEGGFTQPNAVINTAMIQWARRCVGEQKDADLLELYCGNGNFTAPLADRFRRVLATEISKTSVKAARENFTANNIGNVDIARMASEELTQALNGERAFRRLEGLDLQQFKLQCALVDPPRAGLDSATLELISRIPRIVYISCNPKTLSRDLQLLTKSHRVERFALFDQFPYTDHMECGVYLTQGQ